jgi:DNA polymerase/3'-5' exonuclease PolX
MRSLAIEKGYHVSEYAVQKKSKDGKLGPPLPVKCEKDIFDYIGMPYLKPEERSL